MALLFSPIILMYFLSAASSKMLAPAQPFITPPALLQPRDQYTGINQVGWYQETSSGSTFTLNSCSPGYTFTTSMDSVVGCCETTESNWQEWCYRYLPTATSNGSYIARGYTRGCTKPGEYLVGNLIYTGSTKDSHPLTMIGCANNTSITHYFQILPTTAQALVDGKMTSIFTSTSIASTSISSAAPTATPASPKESNKAWIAGIVVGCFSLIAIAGLTSYLIHQRRKVKGRPYKSTHEMRAGYATNGLEGYSEGFNQVTLYGMPLNKGFYEHGVPPRHSMYPIEMPGNRTSASELETVIVPILLPSQSSSRSVTDIGESKSIHEDVAPEATRHP